MGHFAGHRFTVAIALIFLAGLPSATLASAVMTTFEDRFGSATWTGPRPAGVSITGKVGLMGTATQGLQRVSLTGLTIGP